MKLRSGVVNKAKSPFPVYIIIIMILHDVHEREKFISWLVRILMRQQISTNMAEAADGADGLTDEC